MDYRSAGVDIDAATKAVGKIRELARSTFRPEVLSDIGSFGGLFRGRGSFRVIRNRSTSIGGIANLFRSI